jgi:hypothetical protein
VKPYTIYSMLSLYTRWCGVVVSVAIVCCAFSTVPVAAESTEATSEHTVTHKPRIFKRFWSAYPNKSDREGAIDAWNNAQLSDEDLVKMAQGFAVWKDSVEWRKQRGRNVPPMATWLNERMWEKEAPPQAPLTLAEVSSFLVQPLYLAPRLAYAIAGSVAGGLVYPLNQDAGKKILGSSLESTWVWHEFILPES